MPEYAWGILGAIVAMIVREGMPAMGRLLDNWQKNQEARRSAMSNENSQIIDRQEKQLARKDAQIESLQNIVNEIRNAHAGCREEVAELRMCLTLWRGEMIKAGMNPSELPLPRNHPDVDFDAKTAEQNTKIVAAIDAKLHEGPKPGGGNAGSHH